MQIGAIPHITPCAAFAPSHTLHTCASAIFSGHLASRYSVQAKALNTNH